MEKQDQDVILNAYHLARDRIEKRKTDSDLIEDALQQSLLNVLKAQSQVRDLPAYLVRTVYREFRRMLKVERRSAQGQTSAEELDSSPDLDWEDRTHRRLLVRELIATLDERNRILVRLYSEGFPWPYIGRVVGLSPKSAKQTCYQILRRLGQDRKANT